MAGPWDDIINRPINIIAVDDLALNPTAVKIDVQGMEMNVLQGMLKTLERCHPLLLIECSSANTDILRYLEPLGYQRFRWKNVNTSKENDLNLILAVNLPSGLHKDLERA